MVRNIVKSQFMEHAGETNPALVKALKERYVKQPSPGSRSQSPTDEHQRTCGLAWTPCPTTAELRDPYRSTCSTRGRGQTPGSKSSSKSRQRKSWLVPLVCEACSCQGGHDMEAGISMNRRGALVTCATHLRCPLAAPCRLHHLQKLTLALNKCASHVTWPVWVALIETPSCGSWRKSRLL